MKKRKDFRVNLTLSIIIRATSERKAKGKAWMYGSLLRGAEIDSVEACEINPPELNLPVVWQGKCSYTGKGVTCERTLELRRGESLKSRQWSLKDGQPLCPEHSYLLPEMYQ